MEKPLRLHPTSVKVLKLIAAGHSYSQIVDGNPDLNYHDIFYAAEEAVWLDERIGKLAGGQDNRDDRPTGASAMQRARQKFPRAYAPWTEEEDTKLRDMVGNGIGIEIIAQRLQRQPSAIRSRLNKLGLR